MHDHVHTATPSSPEIANKPLLGCENVGMFHPLCHYVHKSINIFSNESGDKMSD